MNIRGIITAVALGSGMVAAAIGLLLLCAALAPQALAPELGADCGS